MSNLGKYQELTTAAAQAGGVDQLIKNIEAGAVAKAEPKLLLEGSLIAVLTCSALIGIGGAVRQQWRKRQTKLKEAENAKRKMLAMTGGCCI